MLITNKNGKSRIFVPWYIGSSRISLLSVTVGLLALSGCSWVKDIANDIGHMADDLLPSLSETHDETASAVQKEQGWGQDYDSLQREQAEMQAVMAQPRGLNDDVPLNENTPSDAEIMQRLENVEMALVELRSEIDKTVPAFQKIMLIDQKISELSAVIQRAQGMPTASPPVSIPVAEAQQNAIPLTSGYESALQVPQLMDNRGNSTQLEKPVSVSAVQDVRFGEHGGRTRLVLDMSGPVAFSTDLDNNEKIFVIELPGVSWNASRAGQVPRSLFVQSYSVHDEQTGGSRLVLQLKKPVRIRTAEVLKPTGTKGYRLFVDIVSE